MGSAFHEEHNFVLLDPLVNDELSIFFGDFDWLSSFSWILFGEFEMRCDDKWGIVFSQCSSDKIADH